MRQARKRVSGDIKTGRIQEAMQRYCLGRDTTKKLAAEAGAVIKIGRSWLCDFDRMDQYMEERRIANADQGK